MSAIGGFASGLLRGMEASDDRRRKKRVDALLSRQADEYDQNREGAYDKYINEGGDPANWKMMQEEKDPFLVRGFNWLRNRFGGDASAAAEQSTYGVVPQEQPQQAIPTSPTYDSQLDAQFMADGGKVYPPSDPRHRPPGYVDIYAPAREFLGEDVPRRAKEMALGATENIRREGSEFSQDMGMRRQAISEASNDRSTGKAVREYVGEGLVGTGRLVGAAADDLLGPIDEAVGRLGSGLLGFMGFGGEGKSAATLRNETENAAPVEATTADVPADQKAAVQAIPTDKPAEASAKEAINTAVQNIPGHPDNPGQQFDWADVAEQNVSPDEIPHVGVKDWMNYRKQHVLASIKQGKSPADAHAEVDQIQQRGFISNLQQGEYLLRVGNGKAATLALRAAFQYFPNGSDIRFGTLNGVDGKPVVVAMGVNEETGEPIKEGEPSVVTPDYLSAMVANFSKPGTMNVWRRDMDEQMFKERQYNEITRPTAQQELNTAGAQEDYYRSGAEKNRADAAYTRAGRPGSAGSGGLKPNEVRGTAEFFREILADMAMDPDNLGEVNRITSTMSRLYGAYNGDLDPNSVAAVVMAAMEGDQASIDFLKNKGLSVAE